MAQTNPLEEIDSDFITEAIAILRLEHAYIARKKRFLITLKKNVKKKEMSIIVKVLIFLGGKPLKSLNTLADCRTKELLKRIASMESSVICLILENCIKSYDAKIKYIESEIKSYLENT